VAKAEPCFFTGDGLLTWTAAKKNSGYLLFHFQDKPSVRQCFGAKNISFDSGSKEQQIRIAVPAPTPAPEPDGFIRYLENYLFDLVIRLNCKHFQNFFSNHNFYNFFYKISSSLW
jgi:hypothetical protein